MRVCSIENDEDVIAMLRRQFAARKWDFSASGGDNLFEFLRATRPEVLIVDWGLDGRCGLSLVEQIRNSEFRELPILVLTGRTSEANAAEALSRGADDYLAKPFSIVELCARFASIRRRARGVFEGYSDPVLSIDFRARRLSIEGKSIAVGPQEWRVLEILVRSPFSMTRGEIIQKAWGSDAQVLPPAVDKAISRLRAALNQSQLGREYIASIRGIGYQFVHYRS